MILYRGKNIVLHHDKAVDDSDIYSVFIVPNQVSIYIDKPTLTELLSMSQSTNNQTNQQPNPIKPKGKKHARKHL
jgi:hypothetical protein